MPDSQEFEKNPFIIKSAESYLQAEDISLIFAHPPDYKKYKIMENVIILGSKGCGKTILLKYLSVSVQLISKELKKLNFCGIYIKRLLQLTDFVHVYKKTQKKEVFEHYFVLQVLFEICSQFIETSISENTKQKIGKMIIMILNIEENGLSLQGIKDFINGILIKIEHNVSIDPIAENPIFWGVQKQTLGLLLTYIRQISSIIKPLPPICLLIDDFQDYESLGIYIIEAFFSHKYLDFLSVKVASRNLKFDMSNLHNEYERDFKIRFLDSNPNDVAWLTFLEKIANNKLKSEWNLNNDNISIRQLLPFITPPHLSWDLQKTPGENYKKLAMDKKEIVKSFSGFEVIAKITMMNPFDFFEICESAFDIETKANEVSIPPGISFKAQNKAILDKSRNYFNVELGASSEYSKYILSLKSLIKGLTDNIIELNKKGELPPGFEGARIRIEYDFEKIKNNSNSVLHDLHTLLRKGIILRDFYVPHEMMIPLLLNKMLYPNEIELKRMICPLIGLSWEYNGAVAVGISKIIEFFQKPYINQNRSKKIDFSPSLFDQINISHVFEAHPHGEKNNKIHKAIEKIRHENIKIKNGNEYFNEYKYFHLDEESANRLYGGQYPIFIGNRGIRECCYFVANITSELTTGVAYEIGFAQRVNKPVFLFWDAVIAGKRFRNEDKHSWHKFISHNDVKEWHPEIKKKMKFNEWYNDYIDEKGKKLNGKVACSIKDFNIDKCIYEDQKKNKLNKYYLNMQPQNKDIENYLISLLSGYNINRLTNEDLPIDVDATCAHCISICISKFQIIDCSSPSIGKGGNPEYALDLGFATAGTDKGESVCMLFNARMNADPVSMFVSGVRCGWNQETYEQELKEFVNTLLPKLKMMR